MVTMSFAAGWVRNSKGTALLCGVFCLLVVGVAATSTTIMARQEFHLNRKLLERVQALEIADGAAMRALGMARANKECLLRPPADLTSGTLGAGSYSVSIESVGGVAYGFMSTATVGDTTETVKVFVDAPAATPALMKGVFSNLDFDANGGGAVRGANLENGSHSNRDTGVGGTVTVSGNASAVGTVTVFGNGKVDGAVQPHVPRIPFPALDYDYYYGIASANKQVLIGDQTLKGTYSPPGGVIWVVGNVTIRSTTIIHGALIATGDIKQTGQCNQYKVGELPAFVSLYGNIDLSGGSDTMEGLVYAGAGNISVTGNHRIRGALWAWGNVVTRGSWGVLDFVQQKPKLTGGDKITILAWER